MTSTGVAGGQTQHGYGIKQELFKDKNIKIKCVALTN
jgi:hypothetical protein